MDRNGEQRDRGFTLIEMLVVLVILGTLTALVVQRAPTRGGGLTLAAGINEVSAALRGARSRAIATQRPMLVAFDPERRAMQVRGSVTGADAAQVLPLPLSMAVVTIAGADGIVFYPDGSSSGGTVELALAGRRVQIGVDWISGRISRHEP